MILWRIFFCTQNAPVTFSCRSPDQAFATHAPRLNFMKRSVSREITKNLSHYHVVLPVGRKLYLQDLLLYNCHIYCRMKSVVMLFFLRFSLGDRNWPQYFVRLLNKTRSFLNTGYQLRMVWTHYIEWLCFSSNYYNVGIRLSMCFRGMVSYFKQATTCTPYGGSYYITVDRP